MTSITVSGDTITIGAFWKSVKDYYKKRAWKFRLVDPETHEEIGPVPKGFDPRSIGNWDEKADEYEKDDLLKGILIFPMWLYLR